MCLSVFSLILSGMSLDRIEKITRKKMKDAWANKVKPWRARNTHMFRNITYSRLRVFVELEFLINRNDVRSSDIVIILIRSVESTLNLCRKMNIVKKLIDVKRSSSLRFLLFPTHEKNWKGMRLHRTIIGIIRKNLPNFTSSRSDKKKKTRSAIMYVAY
jgi:hypothetical protein